MFFIAELYKASRLSFTAMLHLSKFLFHTRQKWNDDHYNKFQKSGKMIKKLMPNNKSILRTAFANKLAVKKYKLANCCSETNINHNKIWWKIPRDFYNLINQRHLASLSSSWSTHLPIKCVPFPISQSNWSKLDSHTHSRRQSWVIFSLDVWESVWHSVIYSSSSTTHPS